MMVQCKNNVGGRQLIIIQGDGEGAGAQKTTSTEGPSSACLHACCPFLCPHQIFDHVHYNGRNVHSHPPLPSSTTTTLAPSSLQSGLKPLDDIFLVSLAAREEAEWALLAATKGNEIEIPQAPFITAAQTLQGLKLSGQLYKLCCCRARVGPSFIAALIDPMLCGGLRHIWYKTAPSACWIRSSLQPTQMSSLVQLMGVSMAGVGGSLCVWQPLQSCCITPSQNSASPLLQGGGAGSHVMSILMGLLDGRRR